MEELFGFLLNNPLILLLVIGWIFATFRQKPKSQQQKQGQEQQQRQGQQQTRSAKETMTNRQKSEQRRRSLQEAAEEMRSGKSGTPIGRIDVGQKPVVTSNEASAEAQSVEDQRLKQLEKLQHRLGAEITSNDDMPHDIDLSTPVENDRLAPLTTFKSKPSVTGTQIQRRFNRQGLVESIIMAEVLGKPRAKRSHHRDHV